MSILAPLLLILTPASADANEMADERFEELVHSDVPLWGASDDQTWPKGFSEDDGSFGCAWQIKMGDWKINRYDGNEEWIRFQNYGVFHCYTVVTDKAGERDDLTKAQFKYSYFINLGERNVQGKNLELWAIQMGGRPGSEYLFLSRAAEDKNYAKLELLQTDCPKGKKREGPSLDILQTHYCAVNSKKEMIRLVESMARRPAIGTMTLQPSLEEKGGSAVQN